MINIYFIRHLKTKGNYERRYIGRTDEDIFEPDEQKHISDIPKVSKVFSSPMKRCIQTADIFYPDSSRTIIEELRETDFGDFEGKCYEELKDDQDYIRFIDSNGSGYVPNGENIVEFKERCREGFNSIIESLNIENEEDLSIAVICHGGTIMAVLSQFDEAPGSFYDYQVANGFGYETEYNIMTRKLCIRKELS